MKNTLQKKWSKFTLIGLGILGLASSAQASLHITLSPINSGLGTRLVFSNGVGTFNYSDDDLYVNLGGTGFLTTADVERDAGSNPFGGKAVQFARIRNNLGVFGVTADWVNVDSSSTYTSGTSVSVLDGQFLEFNTLQFTGNMQTLDGTSVAMPDLAGNVLGGHTVSFSADPVPEPSSTALLGLGGLALMLRRRR